MSLAALPMPTIGKRKSYRDDDEHEDDHRQSYRDDPRASLKQLRLDTIRDVEYTNDVAMSDDAILLPWPSMASSASTPSPISAYPAFELYPEVDGMDVDHHRGHHRHTSSTTSSSSIGLLQPGSTALQHGGNCTQIPRLRMSSHAGIDGKRTMWSHCENCGAIDMVSS